MNCLRRPWILGGVLLAVHLVAASAPSAPVAASSFDDSGAVGVVVSAVFPDGYAPGDADEAVQLWNVTGSDVDISGWSVSDGEGTAGFPDATVMQAGTRLWLARDAAAFSRSFGHDADWSWGERSATVRHMPTTGGGPKLANGGDEVWLKLADGRVADLVVYGDGHAATGWRGPGALAYGTRSIGKSNQVLFRKIDPSFGLPVADTDTAADWAGDRADDRLGRRPRYPGWDLEDWLVPPRLTSEGTVEVAVAPDSLHGFLRRHLTSARQSIVISVYSFKNPDLAELVAEKARQGLAVSVVVDGAPVGGIDLAERWCLNLIAESGGLVYWLDDGGDVRARYRSAHAKLIVVDGRIALIGTENMNLGSTPYDDRSDGTAGRRGVYIATDVQGVVQWAADILARDISPDSHVDVRPFQQRDPARGAPPADFVPSRIGGGSGYRAVAPSTLVAAGVLRFELISAPENTLNPSAGLLGLLARASNGDEVLVEQLSEPVWWGYGPSEGDVALSPRVRGYLDAARRGARVRVLLDGYFDDPSHWNSNHATVGYLTRQAAAEGLDLRARLANPAGRGLHNKMVLMRNVHGDAGGPEYWIHVGSLNGSEVASKVNREAAVQLESKPAYQFLHSVFAYDWSTVHTLWLPSALTASIGTR